MEQCKYCKNMFKRVAMHINKCPTKLSMTPCPHCNKLFKRLGAHVYRCPEKPEEDGKAMKNDSSSDENNDENEKVSNMTPCPHCKKMFKRVSAHAYRCPQNPEENGEMSNVKTSEEEDTVEAATMTPEKGEMPNGEENGVMPGGKTLEGKYYNNGDAPNMTPCPHCNKMFKRVAAHIYRCPQKPEENGEIPNGKENGEMPEEKTIKNDSSSEEKEDKDNSKAVNMTPCPHCNKMFKRVTGHIYRCPEKPKENGEIPDGKTVQNDSPSEEDEDDDEGAADMTPCPHCKKKFNFIAVHISNCPVRDDKDIRDRKVTDNTTKHYFYETASISKSSENTVPKTFIDQSEYRNKYFPTPIFKSSPKPQGPESDKGDPLFHRDYLPSTTQKSPASSYPALNKSTPYSLSYRNSESWETESNSGSQVMPRQLKRPPIHGHQEVQFLDISGNEEGSLTDFSEDNSFYKSSESEDSFSYLNQDLKRPPIHKTKSKSSLQRETNKKLQYATDEEEFLEFRHNVLRE